MFPIFRSLRDNPKISPEAAIVILGIIAIGLELLVGFKAVLWTDIGLYLSLCIGMILLFSPSNQQDKNSNSSYVGVIVAGAIASGLFVLVGTKAATWVQIIPSTVLCLSLILMIVPSPLQGKTKNGNKELKDNVRSLTDTVNALRSEVQALSAKKRRK